MNGLVNSRLRCSTAPSSWRAADFAGAVRYARRSKTPVAKIPSHDSTTQDAATALMAGVATTPVAHLARGATGLPASTSG